MPANSPVRIYTLWSPVYDLLVGPMLDDFRQEAVGRLSLDYGDSLCISGVGTGLDFPFLPPGVRVTGVDLNGAMLSFAERRARRLGVDALLRKGDAQALPFPDSSFDKAYLPLIACVASDGAKVLSEALRVVKPGGRVVVMDKFREDGARPGLARRWLNSVSKRVATNINRSWEDVTAGVDGYEVLADLPGPFEGFFRIKALRKL